jgi:hypothetical protein
MLSYLEFGVLAGRSVECGCYPFPVSDWATSFQREQPCSGDGTSFLVTTKSETFGYSPQRVYLIL